MNLLDLEIDYLDSSENNTNASSLGNYIAEKYKVIINEKTLERVKNYFK